MRFSRFVSVRRRLLAEVSGVGAQNARIIALLETTPGYRTIQGKYAVACATESDIKGHLPTLMAYARRCTSIAELGVRSVVSSWAFVEGLRTNEFKVKRLLMNDVEESEEVHAFLDVVIPEGIDASFVLGSDLEISIPHDFDMVFIDTWHVYGQLRRELERWGARARKFIVMHDTATDGVDGECARFPELLDPASIIPLDEQKRGLLPAIDEFLGSHPEWQRREVFMNSNGLTILERI